jgi:hypothetical protein
MNFQEEINRLTTTYDAGFGDLYMPAWELQVLIDRLRELEYENAQLSDTIADYQFKERQWLQDALEKWSQA